MASGIKTFRTQPQRTAPEKVNVLTIGNKSVDATRAAELAKQMDAITFQKRLPGSNLEGMSRILTGLVGGYYGGRAGALEKEKLQALIQTLDPSAASDFERALLATGDKSVMRAIAGRQSAKEREAAAHQRAMERLRERLKIQGQQSREESDYKLKQQYKLAEFREKLRAQREKGDEGKAPQVVRVMDKYGNESLLTWNKDTKKFEPLPVEGAAPPQNVGDMAPKPGESAPPQTTMGVPTEPGAEPAPEGMNTRKYYEQMSREKAKIDAKHRGASMKLLQLYDKNIPNWDRVLSNIERAAMFLHPKNDNALKRVMGPQGQAIMAFGLQYLPGSTPHKVAKLLEPLGSLVAFDRLNQMRTLESTTGGALGNVSNFEVGLLKSSLANLEVAQDPVELRRSLMQAYNHIKRLKEGARKDIARIRGSFGNEAQPPNSGAPGRASEPPKPSGKVPVYNMMTGEFDK